MKVYRVQNTDLDPIYFHCVTEKKKNYRKKVTSFELHEGE